MPAAVAAAIIAAVGATGVAAAAITIATYVAISVAMSLALGAVAKALGGKPKLPGPESFTDQARGRTLMVRSSIESRRAVYGECIVSGPLLFASTTGTENEYMHLVVALAGHEVSEIGAVYLDDTISTNSRFAGLIRINKHLGADDQTADTDLVAEVSAWSTAHRLRGIAYVYVRLKWDADTWLNGIPNIKCHVRGKPVYDPRTATTAWSRNAALCQRDFLSSSIGIGASASEIDDTMVSAAANVCDEWVTMASEPRVFTTRWDAQLDSIAAGSHPVTVGYTTTPVSRIGLVDTESAEVFLEVEQFTRSIVSIDIVVSTSTEGDGTYAVIFTGGNPDVPATAEYSVYANNITSVTITNPGAGYESTPTVATQSGTGTLAATMGGTLDVKIQESNDKVNWSDWPGGAFTQVTPANDNATYSIVYDGTMAHIRTVAQVLGGAISFRTYVVRDYGDSMNNLGATLGAFGSLERVRLTTTDTLPTPLATGTDYYVIAVSHTQFRLATSLANALAGTCIEIEDGGTGAHTIDHAAQLRYTVDGTFDMSQRPIDVMDDLLTASAGTCIYRQGVYRLSAGAFDTPTPELTADDLRGPVEIVSNPSRREVFNAVRGIFADEQSYFQPTDFPAVVSAAYAARDGETLYQDIELPYTTDSARAQRLAALNLRRARQAMTIKFPATLAAMRLAAWDTVYVTLEHCSWYRKICRILEWTLTDDGGIDLVLQSEAASAYAWNAEEQALARPETITLPSRENRQSAVVSETDIISSGETGGGDGEGGGDPDGGDLGGFSGTTDL